MTLDPKTVVRTEGIPGSECTWEEWRAANGREFHVPEWLDGIEAALAATGRYEEPAGGAAGFFVEVVR